MASAAVPIDRPEVRDKPHQFSFYTPFYGATAPSVGEVRDVAGELRRLAMRQASRWSGLSCGPRGRWVAGLCGGAWAAGRLRLGGNEVRVRDTRIAGVWGAHAVALLRFGLSEGLNLVESERSRRAQQKRRDTSLGQVVGVGEDGRRGGRRRRGRPGGGVGPPELQPAGSLPALPAALPRL